jgi:hypothetical protein
MKKSQQQEIDELHDQIESNLLKYEEQLENEKNEK